MNKKPNQTAKSFREIEAAWLASASLNIRDKFQALKSLGFEIKMVYKPGVTPVAEIKRYIEILKDVIRIPNRSASFVLLLNKMYAEWLSLTGNSNPDILQKKLGKLTIRSGRIVIADNTLDIPKLIGAGDEKEELECINSGTLFLFGTGGDGVINVQCRLVKSNEPVLTLKEYKCCVNSTEIAIINVQSGSLQIGCISSWNDTNNNLVVSLDPGHYKVVAHYFMIGNKFDSFYIVLSKTTEDARNDHRAISILE